MQLDVKRYKCAIVLCDALWLDPDADDLNGIEVNEKRDFLRLDAMIMMAQLNVRKVILSRLYLGTSATIPTV